MSSKKKALRKVINGECSIDDLPDNLREYVAKKADKLFRKASSLSSGEVVQRQFPCQMINGAYAIISGDAEPEFIDGKWYLDGELIVSQKYKSQQRATRVKEKQKEQKQKEDNIINLKPEVLGE